MTPATTTLITAPPPTRPSAPPGLRLQLDPTIAGRGAVDGGWWPHSRDPDAELSGLIAGLDSSHIGRIDHGRGGVEVVEPPTGDQGARRVWSDWRGRVWGSEWDAGQLGR
jgi:virginiamycin B lyase